jgi:hypothetical protein
MPLNVIIWYKGNPLKDIKKDKVNLNYVAYRTKTKHIILQYVT